MKQFNLNFYWLMALVLFSASAFAQTPETHILITNARIFNGIDEALIDGDVLIENNLIKQIGE